MTGSELKDLPVPSSLWVRKTRQEMGSDYGDREGLGSFLRCRGGQPGFLWAAMMAEGLANFAWKGQMPPSRAQPREASPGQGTERQRNGMVGDPGPLEARSGGENERKEDCGKIWLPLTKTWIGRQHWATGVRESFFPDILIVRHQWRISGNTARKWLKYETGIKIAESGGFGDLGVPALFFFSLSFFFPLFSY